MCGAMNRSVSAAVTAAAAIVALSGCSDSSRPAQSSPPAASPGSSAEAQKLRTTDAAMGSTSPQAAYDQAFTALEERCLEHGPSLAGVIDTAAGRLQSAHVSGESRLTIMQHVPAAMPENKLAVPCTNAITHYAALRPFGYSASEAENPPRCSPSKGNPTKRRRLLRVHRVGQDLR